MSSDFLRDLLKVQKESGASVAACRAALDVVGGDVGDAINFLTQKAPLEKPTIKLGNLYKLPEIFASIAAKTERNFGYALYWKDQERAATLDDIFLVAEPVEVTDADKEIYPLLAIEKGFWIYCRDELIQDVIDLAIKQKPAVTPAELLECLEYYIEKDDFYDLG